MWHRLAIVVFTLALAIAHGDHDVEIELEAWHLHEHNPGEHDQPLIISTGTEKVIREEQQKASDGSLFGRSYDIFDQNQNARNRSEQRKKALRRKTRFGANRRPPDSTPSDPPPIIVAVYYYPWYHTDFHGGKYIRGELDPPQLPVLGEYSDRDPTVISQHLEWSRQANVNLWVASWWGPGSGTDITIKDVIMNHSDLKEMKFCLHYEIMGRVDFETNNARKVYGDIRYAAKMYFRDGNYYKINNRPVVYVYLTRVLAKMGILEQVIAMMRTAAFEEGHVVYIVGDHAFGPFPKTPLDAFTWLDAVTNYDIFGAMGQPDGQAKMESVQAYAAEQAGWQKAANAQGCAYIPGATPGYNDKAVRQGDYNAMSRKLDSVSPDGSLFMALLTEGKKLLDGSAGNMLIVNSWNEWHEDTQIEPVVAGGETVNPWNLTRGYVYEGYGEQYLNILREATFRI